MALLHNLEFTPLRSRHRLKTQPDRDWGCPLDSVIPQTLIKVKVLKPQNTGGKPHSFSIFFSVPSAFHNTLHSTLGEKPSHLFSSQVLCSWNCWCLKVSSDNNFLSNPSPLHQTKQVFAELVSQNLPSQRPNTHGSALSSLSASPFQS